MPPRGPVHSGNSVTSKLRGGAARRLRRPANADAALQIHGGNGYALEHEISRALCDARILNISEAAEIQAQVIMRAADRGRN